MNSIFISYRREGGAEMARLVRNALRERGYRVFMDVEDLRSGPFNTALLREIESASDVVVILTPNSLDRCHENGDWLRTEVSHAIKHGKNLIPVISRGFKWPTSLPDDIAALPNFEGLEPSHDFFDASMDRLARLVTGTPVEAVGAATASRRQFFSNRLILATIILATLGVLAAVFWRFKLVPTDSVNQNTQKIVHRAVTQLSDPDLQVEYDVERYTGANVLIGNRGQGIIIASNLTLHWDYRKCPRFEEARVGAPLVTYRYEVDLTKSKGLKLLDTREFKYGAGDVDKFLVGLNFPDYGVYSVWLTFSYKKLGDQTTHSYETKRIEREVCER